MRNFMDGKEKVVIGGTSNNIRAEEEDGGGQAYGTVSLDVSDPSQKSCGERSGLLRGFITELRHLPGDLSEVRTADRSPC